MAVRPSLSVRGIAGPTLALAASPTYAALWVGAAFVGSLLVACVVGRLINAVVGLFVLGCGVGLLAMRSGTIEDLAFANGSLLTATIEGLIWSCLVLAASLLVFRVSGPLPDAVEIENPRRDGPFGLMAFATLGCGVLVLLGVWAVVVSPTKGQALAGTFVGSVLVGLAARMAAPRTPPVLLFVAPILFGCLGYVIAFLQLKGTPIDMAFVKSTLSCLAYPMPVDYAAGTLAGTAVGIGWSRSFLKQEPERR